MTVKNFRKQHTERILYITPDGLTVVLHDPPNKSVLSYEGDGLPSPEYDTTRGPYQHGVNVLGIREPQREIDLVLRWNACSRDEYWTMRHTLINYLRPNRTNLNNSSPGVLRRILSNGEIFDLDCYLTRGPKWAYPRNWDHWSIQESLKFTAFNPVLYNPTTKAGLVQDFTPSFNPNIIIPLMFTFTFGETSPSITKSISISYLGNWESFPAIIINGPYTAVSIQHQTTLDKVALNNYSSPTGETTTIDLTYGKKTILTNSGVSLLGYVTQDSDLSAFSIQPDPEVAGGINAFDVTVSGGSSDTLIQMQYKDRYIGI